MITFAKLWGAMAGDRRESLRVGNKSVRKPIRATISSIGRQEKHDNAASSVKDFPAETCGADSQCDLRP
jgi:hypothetical protein